MSSDQTSVTPALAPAALAPAALAPATPAPAASSPFVSHAQNFEDVMLWRALRTVASGRYLDVGAGEPDADSVTLAFYERGWQGVNVEPLPGPFARLQAARPRDVNLNLAAGAAAGEARLHVVGEESGLSTLDPDLASRHRADGWAVAERPVRVATLAEICAAHVGDGALHFLKIDAEGAELDVLRGADFTRWRPWIILLEAVDPVEQQPQHEAWETEVLTPAGYGCAWFDGLNRFYLAAEHEASLAHAFRAPANVFDDFVRVSEVRLRNQIEALGHVGQERLDEAQARVNAAQARVEEEQARVAAAEARADDAQAYTHAAQHQTSELLARTGQAQALLAEAEARRAEAVAARIEAEAACSEAGAEADSRIAALRDELARTALERNGWAQELFETNRYAADLTVTRQALLEELERLRVHEAWRVAQVAALEAREAALEAREAALLADLAQARAREAQTLQELQELQPLRTLSAAHDKLQAEAAHDRLWLAAVAESSSWRVTRPMRATLRLLGRKGGR